MMPLTMKQKRAKLSDQIRQAVNDCGMSRYQICKVLGIDQGLMSRFMNAGFGLSMANLDALADLLNLNLEPRPTATAKEGQAKYGKHCK